MRSAFIGLSLILGYFLLGPMPSGIGNERDSGGPVMRSRTLAARTDDEPETETNAEADDATLPGPEPNAPTTDDAPTNDDASTDAGAVDVDAADEGEKSSAGEPSAGISGRKREGSFRERHTSPAAANKVECGRRRRKGQQSRGGRCASRSARCESAGQDQTSDGLDRSSRAGRVPRHPRRHFHAQSRWKKRGVRLRK